MLNWIDFTLLRASAEDVSGHQRVDRRIVHDGGAALTGSLCAGRRRLRSGRAASGTGGRTQPQPEPKYRLTDWLTGCNDAEGTECKRCCPGSRRSAACDVMIFKFQNPSAKNGGAQPARSRWPAGCLSGEALLLLPTCRRSPRLEVYKCIGAIHERACMSDQLISCLGAAFLCIMDGTE